MDEVGFLLGFFPKKLDNAVSLLDELDGFDELEELVGFFELVEVEGFFELDEESENIFTGFQIQSYMMVFCWK